MKNDDKNETIRYVRDDIKEIRTGVQSVNEKLQAAQVQSTVNATEGKVERRQFDRRLTEHEEKDNERYNQIAARFDTVHKEMASIKKLIYISLGVMTAGNSLDISTIVQKLAALLP